MSERLQPLGNRVVVRRDPRMTKTEGGIELPDITDSQKYTGTVIEIGPGEETNFRCPECRRPVVIHKKPSVLPGDRVIMPALGGQEIKDWPGGPVTIYDNDFLMARVED